MKDKLTAEYIRNIYLAFFKEKKHAIIPSSSLIPENDPSVLFTTAGMHPLVPYLLGEKHPEGKRVADIQKCLRTGDIDCVGDSCHCTFFEMLGNWSFGDYFKDESITWSYEFLTSPQWLNIDPQRLYFTVFEGDKNAPRDNETYEKWLSLGVAKDHIFFLNDNWWSLPGPTSPCGADTEIFYDTLKPKCSDNCSPSCGCGKYVEIWNNVFMAYNKMPDGTYTKLKQKNVDTGMGLERLFLTLLDAESVYATELFINTIKKLEDLSHLEYDSEYIKSFRIIADHIRTATFVLGDYKAVTPSNTDQGYVLRRIIRRAIRHLKNIGIEGSILSTLAQVVINDYKNRYPELEINKNFIINELDKEEKVFNRTIMQGIKEFNKITSQINDVIPGNIAFKLFDTYGFPLEFTKEMAEEHNLLVDEQGFYNCYKEHQEKSRVGAEHKFKGGLADTSEESIKYHTLTHILHQTLRNMFGDSVEQKGCNITSERLRFDFSFDRKLTDDEIKTLEDKVNEVINKSLEVSMEEMTYQQAVEKGAIGLFKDKYDLSKVKVYSIGTYSKEICDGPHVTNTNTLGQFKITKEESCSAGVRRIKATLSN